MDAVDASAHYEVSAAAETPALLTIVLDTNPRAWAALASTLPLSKAIANILVFANSHLALGSTNQVAVIASHSNRAVWLYPSPKEVAAATAEAAAKTKAARQKSSHANTNDGDDVVMEDAHSTGQSKSPLPGTGTSGSASKFPQFREIETTVLKSIHDLVTNTTEHDLEETTTLLSGALTLALSHINKTAILIPAAAASKDGKAGASGSATAGTSAGPASKAGGGGDGKKSESDEIGLHARILVISVSDSSPAQYIPTMNAVFAAAHAGVAIDVLALRGAATFLQQAAYITRGTFLSPPPASAADPHLNTLHTQGLLAYLMLGFSAASARDVANALIAPSADAVDFRAACFCHRRVVDTGFVCSICLSIFCEAPDAPPEEPGASSGGPPMSECLTCGSRLRLGHYGAKPAVVPRPKKKKKKRLGVPGREETGSAVGTPTA